jgi:large subunit ribosomal protein L6
MSRVGRLPIPVPKEVTVKIDDKAVTVKGPKGELSRTFNSEIAVKMEDGQLTVIRLNETREARALHGLSRALLANMVTGVTKGFEKTIEIVGVGFRAQKAGDKVTMNVGYSHPVEVNPIKGITFSLDGQTKVKISGIDKEQVGEVAAKIVAIKPHDDYKGKGLRYAGIPIKLKAGKAGKAVGRK